MISSTRNLGVYLGVPLVHDKLPRNHYNYILDRMRNKLASWKANSLSLAGRKILVQSVMTSIPIYAMQSQLLPAHVCASIDRINRDFLWGSSDDQRKPHLIGWDLVCAPKASGGLNIRKARETNLVLLAKLGWRLLTKDKATWVKALNSKYLSNKDFWSIKLKGRNSQAWRGICQGREVLKKGLY